eukprot:26079_1
MRRVTKSLMQGAFPNMKDPFIQQLMNKILQPSKPTTCQHPFHLHKQNIDPQSMIFTVLTAIPNDKWNPLSQYQYHSNKDSDRKNKHAKYANFYIENDITRGTNEHKIPPENPLEYNDVMCKNCWIDLIPYLHDILNQVVSTQHLMRRKAQQYIQSYDAFIHWLFMKYLLQQSNIVKYILHQTHLYQLFFDYMINIINILHVQSNLHLNILTSKSMRAPHPLDPNYLLARSHRIYKTPPIEQEEGNYLSLIILHDICMGRVYVYTIKYWKKRHFKYVLKRKGMLSLIQKDILQ